MKKITILIALMITLLGFSQEFPLNFTNPNQLFAGVGGATTALVTDPDNAGNQVLSVVGNGAPYDTAELNLLTNYINLADDNNNTITFRVRAVADYGTRTHLLKFELKGSGSGADETELSFTTAGTAWTTVSLNYPAGLGNYKKMVLFPDFNNASVGSYLFDDFVGGTNIAPPAASAGPTVAAPTPPNRNAADVISVFSQITNNLGAPPIITSHYTDIPNSNFNPNWGGGSGNVTIEPYGGDVVLKKPTLNYQGIVLGSVTDVGAMQYLHFDYWTNSGTSLRISVISNVTGELPYDIDAQGPLPQGQWVGVNVPLSYLTDINPSFNFNIKELKFDEGLNQDFYFDNIYFWKPSVDPAKDATLSDLKVDGTTVAGFSKTKLTYSVVLPKGTTVIPQITAVTKTNSSASHVITQATALPGDATVVVTSQDASTTNTYTVSFSVDTNTPCIGTSTEAREGTFSAGYNYTVETLPGGTSVKYTITILDTDKPGLCCAQLHAISPDIYINMTNTTGQTFEGTVTGLTNGQVISYAGRFPYEAGGIVETKLLQYTVGDACSLGTSKFEASSVKMYPNPVKNTLTIEANGSIDNVSVYNILGQEVMSVSPKSNSATLQTNDLQKGVYMVTTDIEGNISTSKVIKE